MLTKALVLTDGEADLLSRALEAVKTKTFEESETSLDDAGALEVLISSFRDAEKVEPDKEARQISVNPLSKRLFLGHIIGRGGSTDTASGLRHEAGFVRHPKDKELLQKIARFGHQSRFDTDELESRSSESTVAGSKNTIKRSNLISQLYELRLLE